ncbi:hypothetical protein Tco_0532384 [Tanacetum coccineum]
MLCPTCGNGISKPVEMVLEKLQKCVGIKRLLDDLKVTAAQVCVTAAKLNYYCSKIKTAERVSTVRERIKTEERIKIVWRSRLLT